MTLRQANKNIYWAWKSMKQRCQNPKCSAYRNYGARGISVCNEWQNFEPFCEWALSNGYENGLDLDRIDNAGNYEPTNCRWASRKENINNRRKTLYFTVNGQTKCRTEWEEKLLLPNGILKEWSVTHGKEYTEQRLIDIVANGYTEKDFGYSHRRKVLHKETGMVFDSLRAAAKHFGFRPNNLCKAIAKGGSTRKGNFTYQIIEENERL